MRREITDYVKGCTECQRHKINNRPTKVPLEPIWAKPEAMPFETVTIDFITKLPVLQGYDSILTVTDHNCTKAALFIPCVEEISGEEMAALYAKHVFARYSLLSKIISNQDLDLLQNLPENYAEYSVSSKTYQQHIIHIQTDNQNGLISGLSNISASG
jgi:hypothetical protein